MLLSVRASPYKSFKGFKLFHGGESGKENGLMVALREEVRTSPWIALINLANANKDNYLESRLWQM